VTHRVNLWSAGGRRAIALVVVLTLAPLPVLAAAEPGPSRKSAPIRASIAKIPSTRTPKTPKLSTAGAREARGATQSASGQDRSFFKTGPGILALAVMVAGTGYAIYSTQNDRIKSPGKE
jgi:hypothetical protein